MMEVANESNKTVTDGGPAFPVKGVVVAYAKRSDMIYSDNHPGDPIFGDKPGMSLRDYFIAHAPAEPQPWFKPVMPTRPEYPNKFALSQADLKAWENERLDYDYEGCSQELKDFGEKWVNARTAVQEWETEALKQRYVQWPAAWADAMLEARK